MLSFVFVTPVTPYELDEEGNRGKDLPTFHLFTIDEAQLRHLFDRAATGEDSEILVMELFANATWMEHDDGS